MERKHLEDLSIYQMASRFTNLFNKAIQEAREINRQKGLPNVFSRNGKIYYELPNGEITTENPLK
jgi:hypothetical protein